MVDERVGYSWTYYIICELFLLFLNGKRCQRSKVNGGAVEKALLGIRGSWNPPHLQARGERSRSEANEGEGVGHKKQQQTGMKGSEDYDRKETVWCMNFYLKGITSIKSPFMSFSPLSDWACTCWIDRLVKMLPLFRFVDLISCKRQSNRDRVQSKSCLSL